MKKWPGCCGHTLRMELVMAKARKGSELMNNDVFEGKWKQIRGKAKVW